MRFAAFARTPPSNSGEESGLSESAYEIIGTDSEENYAESMGESIGSLDFHRPDDVRSLADTEHTDGDDESVTDEPLEQTANSTYSVVGSTERSDDMDESQVQGAIPAPLASLRAPPGQMQSSVDTEAERSSVDYTRKSLQLPSMSGSEMTEVPEANSQVKSWFNPAQPQAPGKPEQPFWASWRNLLQPLHRQRAFILSMAITGGLLGLTGLYYAPQSYVQDAAVSVPPVSGIATATSTCEPSAETATSLMSVVHPSGDLITVEDAPSDEWRFGYKQPTVDMMPLITRNGDVFVWIPPDVQKSWLSKGCVTITASKHDAFIDTIISAAENGIVINFPSEPAHGTINLTLATTCRPKVHKVMTVDFGLSTLEMALERSRQLRGELFGFLQPAAQQVGDFMQSFGGLSQQLREEAAMLSDFTRDFVSNATARKQLEAVSDAITQTFTRTRESSRDAWRALARNQQSAAIVCDLQEQAELSLLNAQISAALWWYRITGRVDEAREYRHKASKLMAQRAAQANKTRKERRTGDDTETWAGLLRKLTKPECEGRSRMCPCRNGEGLCPCRSTHECKPVR
jgi:hypothetical protein